MNRIFQFGVALTIIASSHAQEQMLISIDEIAIGSWTIYAELLNPDPNKEIIAVISDLNYKMEGAGFHHQEFSYNPQFDCDFCAGSVVVITDTSIEFAGSQWLPPLNNQNGPDSSNPLWIASFGAESVDSFRLRGQINGAYSGVPFPEVFFYQNADGSPGTVPFSIEINPIPPAGTGLVLAGFCLGYMRRKR